MKGIILSKTRGSNGVVALISRYEARPSRKVPWILKRPSFGSSSNTAAEKDLVVVDRAEDEAAGREAAEAEDVAAADNALL